MRFSGWVGDGVLIDASTVSPETTADLAAAVGGRLLASPILGSPTAVLAAEATYLIAGPRELYQRVQPAYDALRNRLDDIISGDHRGWLSTTLGAKDVRLAEELARSHGVRLPLAEAVKRRYEEAAAGGWADADIAAVVS